MHKSIKDMRRRKEKENGLKDKEPPQKRIHYGRFKFTAANT